jgi:hypothetical protein
MSPLTLWLNEDSRTAGKGKSRSCWTVRRSVVPVDKEVIRHAGEYLNGTPESLTLLSQYDLVTAPENLDLG